MRAGAVVALLLAAAPSFAEDSERAKQLTQQLSASLKVALERKVRKGWPEGTPTSQGAARIRMGEINDRLRENASLREALRATAKQAKLAEAGEGDAALELSAYLSKGAAYAWLTNPALEVVVAVRVSTSQGHSPLTSALRGFLNKLSRQAARGWPLHVSGLPPLLWFSKCEGFPNDEEARLQIMVGLVEQDIVRVRMRPGGPESFPPALALRAKQDQQDASTCVTELRLYDLAKKRVMVAERGLVRSR